MKVIPVILISTLLLQYINNNQLDVIRFNCTKLDTN